LEARPELEVHPSVTNFVLFRCPDAAGLHGALLERGVLIRRQDHLPGLDGCLRVSIGTPEQNDAFLVALDAALDGLGASAPVPAGGGRHG
jgi:histidinol-phosphate aminotransferase